MIIIADVKLSIDWKYTCWAQGIYAWRPPVYVRMGPNGDSGFSVYYFRKCCLIHPINLQLWNSVFAGSCGECQIDNFLNSS